MNNKQHNHGSAHAAEAGAHTGAAVATASHGISRRNFLGGAGVAALGAGLLGSGLLTGCSPQKTSSASSASSASGTSASASSGATATGTSVWAQLNPQDYNYTTNSITDWSKTKLFTEMNIGSVTFHNRMIKSAATSGTINDAAQMVPFYHNLAQGGVGGIFIEGGYKIFDHLDTSEWSYTTDGSEDTRLTLDESPTAAVVEEIHNNGVPCFAQIKTGGLGAPEYKWDNLPATGTNHNTSELSDANIQLFIQDVVSCAEKYHSYGVDGIELNCGGDNVWAWFLSRFRNDRPADDPYGPGSIENRIRIVAECISGIKEKCGQDFPVQILLNGVEENDDPVGSSSLASSVEEVSLICEALEAAGADSLELRLGVFGNHDAQFMNDGYFGGYGINGSNSFGSFFDFSKHFGGYLDASHSGCGLMLGAAAEVKKHVSIPVGAVTYMDPAHAPDFFEKALEDGMVDFFFMNRPLGNADPDYPNKLKEGRIDEIRPCCHCLHCAGDFGNHLGVLEGCRVNVCKGRAFTPLMPEGYDLPAGDGKKNVMVIGGGPAGMEAARVCAERGYTVTLYEKSSMGGLLDFAASVKGPHENLEQLRNYFVHILDVDGVTVKTGTEVDADFVRQQKPDVVFVATGGLREDLDVEGTSSTPVVSITNFMMTDLGENVLVTGFNAQALDTALRLTAEGKKVSMVAPDPEAMLGKGQSRGMKSFVLPGLRATGCRIFPSSSIKSIGDGEVTISSEVTGVETTIACDAVVNASDMVPNTALTDALSGEFDVHAVGDCADPWDIQAAIATANLAARAC